jgi:glycosyltransferase involved in cell wall biosynthesis
VKYRLAVLTHGDAATLEESLASFTELVRPLPDETVLVIDGPTEEGLALLDDDRFRHVRSVEPQGGFCAATRELWEESAGTGVDFVFWLEADFLFERTVNLELLAATLRANPELVQMSLMRGPANSTEHAAGSLVAAYPDSFQMHFDYAARRYMSQRLYWTTNPSLIPLELMSARSWPDGPSCEGVFTHQILRDLPKARFGVWGHGESWIRHLGVRDGSGFGY